MLFPVSLAGGQRGELSMYNEPVVFMRFMKVEDLGGSNPNLVSKDGRKLTVVHLQNQKLLYELHHHALWSAMYMSGRSSLITIDNVTTRVPDIAGLEDAFPE